MILRFYVCAHIRVDKHKLNRNYRDSQHSVIACISPVSHNQIILVRLQSKNCAYRQQLNNKLEVLRSSRWIIIYSFTHLQVVYYYVPT